MTEPVELPTRQQVWDVIASIRDAAPRLPNDASTDEIIDALVDAGLLTWFCWTSWPTPSRRAERRMAEQARYLPMEFISRLCFVLGDVEDRDVIDRVKALVQDAYTGGYADGYVRGMVEQDCSVRAEWKRAEKGGQADG
jgi:hypothetical protein